MDDKQSNQLSDAVSYFIKLRSQLSSSLPQDDTSDAINWFIQQRKQQPSVLTGDSQPTDYDGSWNSFKKMATNISQKQGFPANVLLAQAANESSRGEAAPGNNYFGVKGSGTAGSNYLATSEYGSSGYYPTKSKFAAYNTPEDSINAYIKLVMSYPGVSQAVASGDTTAVIKAIADAGYATSPTYARDIMATPEFKGE